METKQYKFLFGVITPMEAIHPDFVQRWTRSLSNWTYLSSALANMDPDLATIGKLLEMEIHGKARSQIIERLVQRASMKIREHFRSELQVYMRLTCGKEMWKNDGSRELSDSEDEA